MKHAVFVIFLFISVGTAFAQQLVYQLPSYPERFGKGIRKVVMIEDHGARRTAKISRDGRIIKPLWPMQEGDSILKYDGGEVNLKYSPDSILTSSFRIVYDDRGEVDTIYYWHRYGDPTCYTGRHDTTEWLRVETHQYEYNRRGGIVEERVYYNGTLRYARQYKLRYHMGSPKHPTNKEEFYLQTASNDFIECREGYIAHYGMLPRTARQFIASMGCGRSEVAKVVCTQNEYHFRPWPEGKRKVPRRHWWVVLADSTCLCFDNIGQFQMVEHYGDGLEARWISKIPEKALAPIKQKCGTGQKYHILRVSMSDKGYRIYYWIETPGIRSMGLPPSYMYDKDWNVRHHSRPI